jgi:hypothetical protein
MSYDNAWIPLTLTALVAGLQWWATRKAHQKKIAMVRARHLKAQQEADKLLQMSRQQNVQLQQELAMARLAVKRPQREPAAPAPAAAPKVDARSALMKILDEAPSSRHAPPKDGFAETMPSLQFNPSAMGSL